MPVKRKESLKGEAKKWSKKVSVYFTTELWELVELAALESGMTVSEVVIEVLEKFIDEKGGLFTKKWLALPDEVSSYKHIHTANEIIKFMRICTMGGLFVRLVSHRRRFCNDNLKDFLGAIKFLMDKNILEWSKAGTKLHDRLRYDRLRFTEKYLNEEKKIKRAKGRLN